MDLSLNKTGTNYQSGEGDQLDQDQSPAHQVLFVSGSVLIF